jgi:hypothetical protein
MGMVDQLGQVLAKVQVGIEVADGGHVLRQGGRTLNVPDLPLENIDPALERAELLALAAGIDAGLTLVATLEEETFREGAATLLCRVERQRFAEAFNAVAQAMDTGPEGQLLWRPLGAGLCITYIREDGWRFSYLTEGHRRMWDASLDSVASCARSNLYAYRDMDGSAGSITFGDGYDGTRAILAGDVFYGRAQEGGIPIAVPGRDTLLVGSEFSADDVSAAYEKEEYPLSRDLLTFRRGMVETR